IKLCQKFNWKAPVQEFRKTADLIKSKVEELGFNKEMNTYTREFSGKALDASLLTLALVDYCEAASPRMEATTDKIIAQLSENKLVYRYLDVEDGLSGKEGTFGVCSFWLAEC